MTPPLSASVSADAPVADGSVSATTPDDTVSEPLRVLAADSTVVPEPSSASAWVPLTAAAMVSAPVPACVQAWPAPSAIGHANVCALPLPATIWRPAAPIVSADAPLALTEPAIAMRTPATVAGAVSTGAAAPANTAVSAAPGTPRSQLAAVLQAASPPEPVQVTSTATADPGLASTMASAAMDNVDQRRASG
ncbi:MAG TPA: hypothetical protein VEL07_03025 [Planctomycetota bacterium]|nr:hypothetical protein [Planctomycetota bacterium]